MVMEVRLRVAWGLLVGAGQLRASKVKQLLNAPAAAWVGGVCVRQRCYVPPGALVRPLVSVTAGPGYGGKVEGK